MTAILSNLKSEKGRKKKRILGRGKGSGRGKTSGRGHKGSGQRTGSGHLHPGFEGGQMPLMRRTPKRGFNNKKFGTVYQIVNVGGLNCFEDNATVDKAMLKAKRLIQSLRKPVKILAKGELKRQLTLKVDAVSSKAEEVIKKNKGSVEIKSC